MKRTLLTLGWLLILANTAFAQGTVNFVNRITGTLDAPVFDTDGVSRLSGSSYLAQLYAGPSASTLAPVGAAVPFRTGAGAGYVDSSPSGTREIPGVPAGKAAFLQVRAWDATKGSTFESAQAAGGRSGSSSTFSVVTGGGLVPPAPLIGLTSFSLASGARPTITQHPASVTVDEGGLARFEVTASGPAPLAYQWRKGSSNLPGATSRVLEIKPVSAADAGSYSVRVSNPHGATDSNPATLKVTSLFTLELVAASGGSVSASPALAGYAQGARVTLTATPASGFSFYGWLGDLSGSANPAELLMNASKRVEAIFSPLGGTLLFGNRNLGYDIDAPIFDTDGVTRLSGSAFLAQLYAGPSSDALAPVGDPVEFRDGEGAGYFPTDTRAIPSVPPGSTAWVQVRAWARNAGATYEAAVAAQGKRGASRTLSLVTGNAGNPPTLPTPLLGLTSFSLVTGERPTITQHPASVTVDEGGFARFEVTASGPAPLAYQWRKGSSNLPGATSRVLEIKPVSAADAGSYSVRVSNPHGATDSNPATLKVTSLFTLELVAASGGSVSASPALAGYAQGARVTLTATPASGFSFYGWLGDLSGSANPAELLMNASKRVEAIFSPLGGTLLFGNRNLGYDIDAPIFDTDGVTRLSGSAFLAQLYAGPSSDALAPVGDPVEFRDGEGAGYFPTDTRAIPSVPPGSTAWVQVRAWARNAGATYEAAVAAQGKRGASRTLSLVTGNAGNPPTLPTPLLGLTSFSLVTGERPTITQHPASVTVDEGGLARFEVTASGPAPLAYQWRKGSSNLPGATSRVLEIKPVSAADAGSYSVRVSNPHGATDSNPATLQVNARVTLDLVSGLGGRIEAVPAGPTYPPGTRVTLSAVAEAGYRFSGWSGDLAGTDTPLTLILDSDRTVNAEFLATGGTVYFANYSPGLGIDAPVLDTNGVTRLAGDRYVAQLYAAAPDGEFQAVGQPLPFRTDDAAGYLRSEQRSLPQVPPGGTARVQIRAWDTTDGATYEACVANGGAHGSSAILTVITGNVGIPPTLPAFLLELESFQLGRGSAPEIVSISGPVRVFHSDTAKLDVEAVGSAPLSYQWYRGSTGDTSKPVGSNTPSLETEPLTAETTYWVRVSNHRGSTDSLALRIGIERRTQTLTFDPPASISFGSDPLPLLATASSGLPVEFTLLSGPASLADRTLTVIGSGEVRILASQAGDARFLPAPAIEKTIVVRKGTAVVTLDRMRQIFDGAPKSPLVSVQPPGLAVRLTFSGVSTPPSAPGKYAVEATVIDPNFTGSALGVFEIATQRNLVGAVFHDLNGDGSRHASEPGLPGVALRLLALDNATVIATATTEAQGAFAFDGIASGSYYLQEINPAGFVSTTPDLRLISLTADALTEILFGDQSAGSVSGWVFEDADGDGLRDDAEPGIPAVTLRLSGPAGLETTTTSADGSYRFDAIASGSYTVEEIDPPGFTSTTPNVRTVSVAPGGAATANFGDHAAGTISGVVFLDLDGSGSQDSVEPGLAGVSVRLFAQGWQQSRITDDAGRFLFEDVVPGSYALEEIDPLGHTSTTPNRRTVSLPSGGSASVTFGDQATGTVGGLVFEDANGNGQREPGESGLAGVLVRLIGDEGQRTQSTAGDGSFLFTEVSPGSYSLEEIDPPGFSSSTPNLRRLSVASGGAATATFGDQAAASVAGLVFADTNGNGLPDPGEAGIGGVSVRLVGNDGQRTTLTSGDGTYQFTSLVPGSYSVEETDPVGFVSTTPNLRAVSLVSGSSASAIFGDQPVKTISGIVFEDQNGNGQFDPTEPGIGGIELALLHPDSGEVLRQTLTSGDGRFVFADVPAGDYLVRQIVPDAYTLLTSTPGALAAHSAVDPSVPSSVSKPVTLQDNGASSVNFANHVKGQLSGVVFDDLDGDGLPSLGETGLGGVSIELRQRDSGNLVASTTSSGDGLFSIADLTAGAYEVVQQPIAGYTPANPRLFVSLTAGGGAVANFPNRAAGTVSGRAFNDENGDGLRSPSEPGMGGVRITLHGPGGSSRETFTSGDGSFLFAEIEPGEVTVEQATPDGFRATTPTRTLLTVSPHGSGSTAFGNQSESVLPPMFTAQPADLTLAQGGQGTLTAVVAGTEPLELQWLKSGSPVPGATNATLVLNDVQPADDAIYQLRASNLLGTALSRETRVTVATAPSDPFHDWAASHRIPANLGLPHLDADADGLPNLLEFVLGSAPLDPSPGVTPISILATRDGQSRLGFEFPRAHAAASVRLFLETSTDLVHWTESPATVDVVESRADNDLVRVLDHLPIGEQPMRFLRLGTALPTSTPDNARLTLRREQQAAHAFVLTLEGTPGQRYAIEWSSDLLHWTVLQEIVAGSSPVTLTDAGASDSPLRFYRAVPR